MVVMKKPCKDKLYKALGQLIGLEPTTFGTTNRRSNRVSYSCHLMMFPLGMTKVIHCL